MTGPEEMLVQEVEEVLEAEEAEEAGEERLPLWAAAWLAHRLARFQICLRCVSGVRRTVHGKCPAGSAR